MSPRILLAVFGFNLPLLVVGEVVDFIVVIGVIGRN